MTKKKFLIICKVFYITLAASYSCAAQDQSECEKLMTLGVNAINKNDSFELEKKLARDFKFLGNQGDLAFRLLPAYVRKARDKIEEFHLLSAEQTDHLKLNYSVTWKDKGNEQTSIVCNSKNLLVAFNVIGANIRFGPSKSTSSTPRTEIEVK